MTAMPSAAGRWRAGGLFSGADVAGLLWRRLAGCDGYYSALGAVFLYGGGGFPGGIGRRGLALGYDFELARVAAAD